MEYEKRIDALRKKVGDISIHLYLISRDMKNENEQKSKKIENLTRKDVCTFKALYATRKYGCSGIEGNTECLECEFRR